MTSRRFVLLAVAGALAVASQPSQALTINLFDWAINIDGTVSDVGTGLPGSVNGGGFDFATGLGTLTVTLGGAGAHNVDLFVDHEIDEATNTFFNESGATNGASAVGQSWEIDEPGYVFGDIFANFSSSALDNSNAVPAGSEDDVSMAMGWDFNLLAGETATVSFLLSAVMPTGGFYLVHTDPDSDASIYFGSTSRITGGGPTPNPVPVPLALMTAGLIGLGFARRRAR